MSTILDTPETRLLACVLRDAGQVRGLAGIVAGSDFENPTVGVVFDGLCALAGLGVATNAMLVAAHLADWGVPEHALNLADLVALEAAAPVNAYEAPDYGRMVRAQAVNRGVLGIGRFLTDNQGESGYDLGAKARAMLDDVLAGGVGARLNPKTLEEILAQEFSFDWLIPGLMERGDRLVLTGHEGYGKSWLLRQIAITAAAGLHPLRMSEVIDPVRVLIVDAENSEQQIQRGSRYITGRAESLGIRPPGQHVMVQSGLRLDFTKPAEVNEVHRLVDRHKPDLLYIGPLYKLVPGEITTDDDAAPLIVALDSFRERGLTLLMEAHAGHGKAIGGDRDMRPRGSSALLGWPEFGFGLRPMDDDPDMAHLVRWRGDREEREWPRMIRRGAAGELPWMPVSG